MLERLKANGLVLTQEVTLKVIHPCAYVWTLFLVTQVGWANVTTSQSVGDSFVEHMAPTIDCPSLESTWTIVTFTPFKLEQTSSENMHMEAVHIMQWIRFCEHALEKSTKRIIVNSWKQHECHLTRWPKMLGPRCWICW